MVDDIEAILGTTVQNAEEDTEQESNVTDAEN